jgi:hypothetical protein
MMLLLSLPGHAGMIAGLWCRKRDPGYRLIEKNRVFSLVSLLLVARRLTEIESKDMQESDLT